MKVKVKGKNVSVNFVDEIEKTEEAEVLGQFIKIPRKIEIVKGKSMLLTAETIIHELTHAFLYECGLNSDDEEYVNWISRQFLDIYDTFVEVFEKMYPRMKGKFKKSQKVISDVE